MRYRRHLVPGATVFLTLVTRDREPLLTRPDVRAALSEASAQVARVHPFRVRAFVVMPDHCHLLWTLPDGQGDFPLRVRLIKHRMSRRLGRSDGAPAPIWQRRFWEHTIRDEDDLRRHVDYIHFNPVKHGYVASVSDWPDSSFAEFVARGVYARDWGLADVPADVGE